MADGARMEPCLRARGVTLRIDGTTLLDDVDFAPSPVGVTVVMGPNGAGKSSLLRVLHGLIAPTTGVVTGDRTRQAMVFQKPVLLRRSVAANLDFALRGLDLDKDARRERRDALLAQAGLIDRAGAPARRLSGGEQQRLALVRALAGDPQILLLDEPTASLDPAATRHIEEILRDAAVSRGVKAILVTHDIGQARRIADDVAFMRRGRISAPAPADWFFDDPGDEAARAYLAGQLYE